VDITSPITSVSGVGAVVSQKLGILGVQTISDLIQNYPRRYEDYSNVQRIVQLKPGLVTIKAVVKQATGRYVRRGMHITEAVVSDESGSVRLIWFNQPYRAASLKIGSEYYISGDFALRRQRLSIQNPSMELVDSFTVNTARIVPIYRETKGLKSSQIRKAIRQTMPLIQNLPETLPDWLINAEELMSRSQAVQAMHFPTSIDNLERAKHRLGFEEVFELTLAALLNRQELVGEHSLSIPFERTVAQQFVSHLPFTLTADQKRVVWQLFQDMQRDYPMNRLIEGDVGSGKTVVATMAAAMVMQRGFQVALMAPTELLARQHADTLHRLLEPLGLADYVCLLVGGLKTAQKRSAQASIKMGTARCIVGTHALIQEKVDMKKLGLIVIDEQHRFGVDQRKQLQAKAGHMPHVLHLTATPIPRSLALTLYGELDISVIGVKPKGRLPIQTTICPPTDRAKVYTKAEQEIEAGRQIFVVCPLVNDSDLIQAESAEKVYDQLRTGQFKHRQVGLMHGKMKADKKDAVMQAFVRGELDVLVSTTVIEVGVDVPNATVMLVENAERFGLAQIHQLRGRVGRSDHQGYCYLMLGDSQPPSRRLRALEQSNDGFALAELDLEIRGPGAIYGTTQHGQLDLRVARLTDVRIIAAARSAAQQFINVGEKMVQYKELERHVMRLRSITNLN
jgi:ATP-dependent DNA helicase RecG